MGKEVIKVVGQKLDPLECYHAADVVIGTARVALEALSCERPLIAAGNTSYVGYLEPTNLEKAWSVYFGDHHWAYPLTVERLTDDLRHVLENQTQAEQNSTTLRKWVTKNFDIKKIAKQTLQFYDATISGKELSETLVAQLPTPDQSTPDKTRQKEKTKLFPDDRPSSVSRSQPTTALPKECSSRCSSNLSATRIVVVNDGSTDNTDEVAHNQEGPRRQRAFPCLSSLP